MYGLKLLVGQTNFMLIAILLFIYISLLFWLQYVENVYTLNHFIGIPGRFDRNGFTMSSKSTSLTFYSKLDDVSLEQLRDSLQVRSYKTSAVEN